MSLRFVPSGVVQAQPHGTYTDVTLAGLAESIAKQPEAGLVSYEFGARFGYVGKTIQGIEMTVNLALFLPIWSHADAAEAWERREWRRFLKALRFHEGGHLHLTRVFARRIYRALHNTTPTQFDATFQDLLKDLEARHQEYDRANGHGTKQLTPFGNTTFYMTGEKQWKPTKPRPSQMPKLGLTLRA